MIEVSRGGPIDAKDWAGVRRTFADTLDMDYSSLFGDPPARVEADQQVAGWRLFAGAACGRSRGLRCRCSIRKGTYGSRRSRGSGLLARGNLLPPWEAVRCRMSA